VSSAKFKLIILLSLKLPNPSRYPNSFPLNRILDKVSATMLNKKGDNGSPCFNLFLHLKYGVGVPLILMHV
jgi:hypothetical protein